MLVTITDLEFSEDIDECFDKMLLNKKGCICCGVLSKVKNRDSYQCSGCGKQFYPKAGTIFEKMRIHNGLIFVFMTEILTNKNIRLCEIYRGFYDCLCYTTAHRLFQLIKTNKIPIGIDISKK